MYEIFFFLFHVAYFFFYLQNIFEIEQTAK